MMPRMRKEVNLEVQLQSMWQLHSQVTEYKSLSSHCYAAQELGKRLVEERVIGYGSTYCMRVLGQ